MELCALWMTTGQSGEARVLRCSGFGAEDGGVDWMELRRWTETEEKIKSTSWAHLGSLILSHTFCLSQTQADTQTHVSGVGVNRVQCLMM